MNFKNLTKEERIVDKFISEIFEEHNQNMVGFNVASHWYKLCKKNKSLDI